MLKKLRRLPALAPEAVLGELVGLWEKLPEGELPPAVTVHFQSGLSMRGLALALERGVLLLQRQDSEVSYVAVSHLEAVTVHTTPQNVDRLSQGRLSPPPAQTVSRLGLKRRFLELLEKMEWSGEVAWDSYADDSEALAALGVVFDQLDRALIAVRADEQGREALSQVERLNVRPGADGLRILREGATVTLETGLYSRPQGDDLGRALERIL